MEDKLLFIDIDGTLTHDDGIISDETKEVLKKFNNQNKNVVLTSGRARNRVKDICTELSFKYFISSNGSEVYDNELNEVIYRSIIDARTTKFIITLAVKYNVELVLAIDDKEFTINNENYYNDYINVKQCMLKGDNENLMKVRRKLSLLDNVYVQNKFNQFEHGYYWFSILPLETSKGSAALYLANHLNYSRDSLIAIGNDYNDISIFKEVGKGVAVGNACNELKEIATSVIGDNNSDGVKEMLEKYI